MERRSFLGLVAAMIAASAVPAVASDPYANIREMLEAYDELNSFAFTPTMQPYYGGMDLLSPEADAKLTEFVHKHLMPMFARLETDVAMQQARAIMTGSNDDFRKIPPVLLEALLPLAVLREYVLVNQLARRIPYKKFDWWMAFHENYGHMTTATY